MKKPKVASFFAGIGGFDLGFEQAGFEIDYQCEIFPFCRSVLQHHWPNTPFANDIASLQPEDLPDTEIWCGGFPCQDLSVARGSNGRHGLKGSRSGLFFKLSELANVKKPRVILIENVHGLLNANHGKDFAELLHTFSSLNYAVSWRLLNSRYFGVPQSRPRVYICAWLGDPVSAGNVLLESRIPVGLKNERTAFLSTSWQAGNGPIPPKLAFCLAATSGRHTGTDWSRTYIPYADEVRRLTPLECERLQGFPDHWTKLHLADTDVEKSDSLRYHALGNAVSVAVVKWIAERIQGRLSNDTETGSNLNEQKFMKESLERWPSLRGSKMINNKLSALRESDAKAVWPNAGILWQDAFMANSVFPSPCEVMHSDLMDIVERHKPDPRYFLSPNAAEGILRRVDAQNRHLFPYLRYALEKLSGRAWQKSVTVNKLLQNEIFSLELTECVSL